MAYSRFENIKEGDLVLVHSWIGSFRPIHNYTPCKVVKVNKKTFKLDKYETRTFTKDNGSIYGGDNWDRINVIPYDEEFYQKHLKEKAEEDKRKSLLNKVRGIDFNRLTTEQLEQICAVIG